jgi:hypothetical protein
MSLRREERKSCKRRDTLTKFITDHRPRVKNNQDSPLLRLPPELRDRIWGFAIGAHVLRVVYTNSPANKTVVKIQPPFKENRNTLALLRTCRQIYSETALLPYKSSTYSCDLWQPLSHGLRHMKRFQRAQIEDLQVELDLPWSRNPVRIQELCVDKLAILPGLKRVRILAFRDKYVLEHELEESRETIRNSLEPILAGTNISTMFEVAEMGSYEFTKK